MPRKKVQVATKESSQQDLQAMHEKNKVAIDIKLYFLEEFAMLLFELFRVHEEFEQESHRPGRRK